MITNIIFLLLIGSAVGAAAGYLGSFMVLKRMSLVGDALSHVALPGMAIAIALHYSPMIGAFIALTIAVVGIWFLSEKSEIYPEAMVGIFFTSALAIGILITPEPDLLEALFGNIENINLIEGILAIILSIIILLLTKLLSKKLVLGIISEDLAKSTGIAISKVNLIYMLLVGTVVALGVKFVGTLLTGALVIIPAASAKNISHGISQYYIFSILFGVLSSVIGILMTNLFNFQSGASVVLTGIGIFSITYLIKKTA